MSGQQQVLSSMSGFRDKKILVIGDLMLDEYVHGRVERISPEAPVPVLNVNKSQFCLGGAANVAHNALSLGASVCLMGLIGNDYSGELLKTQIEKSGIPLDYVYTSTYRETTHKTRYMAGHQQILRVDQESIIQANETEMNFMQSSLQRIFREHSLDGVILEDYDKGCLNPFMIRYLLDECQKRSIFVSVDPKKDHFFDYSGVSLFKPNLKELQQALSASISSAELKTEDILLKLNQNGLHVDHLLLTLSKDGVWYQNNQEKGDIPAFVRSIADVSGAGDTVITVATLCMISGMNLGQAAYVSNIAGGMVCEKPGVEVLSFEELYQEVKSKLNA